MRTLFILCFVLSLFPLHSASAQSYQSSSPVQDYVEFDTPTPTAQALSRVDFSVQNAEQQVLSLGFIFQNKGNPITPNWGMQVIFRDQTAANAFHYRVDLRDVPGGTIQFLSGICSPTDTTGCRIQLTRPGRRSVMLLRTFKWTFITGEDYSIEKAEIMPEREEDKDYIRVNLLPSQTQLVPFFYHVGITWAPRSAVRRSISLAGRRGRIETVLPRNRGRTLLRGFSFHSSSAPLSLQTFSIDVGTRRKKAVFKGVGSNRSRLVLSLAEMRR